MTAAYVLMQELRRHTHARACAGAQVSTPRERLFKLAAWIDVSVRRVVVQLPRSFAYQACWLRVAARFGAAPR